MLQLEIISNQVSHSFSLIHIQCVFILNVNIILLLYAFFYHGKLPKARWINTIYSAMNENVLHFVRVFFTVSFWNVFSMWRCWITWWKKSPEINTFELTSQSYAHISIEAFILWNNTFKIRSTDFQIHTFPNTQFC